MKEYLKKLPKEILNLIYSATDVACFNCMPAYLVGGFARDLLLGARNLDLDIVVEGDGIRFAEYFAKRLQAKLVAHKRFGTATIYHGQVKIDVSSARKEFYPHPGHLPVVGRGPLKDDLFRRDFTINAMAIYIGCEDFGRLIDLFGGKPDLRAKKIRVLHPLSFMDDPTRILRAIRFEQRFDFKIEPGTLKLLKQAVKSGMLSKVEPQRVRDDLILMLQEEHPLKEIRRLQKLTGFSFISRGLSLSAKGQKLMRSLEIEINWFCGVPNRHRHLDSWLVYFMALLEPLKGNDVGKIFRRFAFRKQEEKRMLSYKKISLRLARELKKEKIPPSRVFALLEPLSYEVIILLKAKYKDRRIQKHIRDFFMHYHGMRLQTCGDDLLRMGIAPGPKYQKIFQRLLNAKLDGLIETKQEEVSLIKRLAG